MSAILDSANLGEEAKNFLWIRHWEIEIARELIWNSLPIQRGSQNETLEKLHSLSQKYLVPNMLPKTSIRWRGIVGLIGTANYSELEKLLISRKLVIENVSYASKLRGIAISNWIRLKATARLPKGF
jgi:hypothetical protein